MRNARHPDQSPDLAGLIENVASVAEPSVPRAALLSPWDLSATQERRYGKGISVQVMSSADDRLADCLDTINRLRAAPEADHEAIDAAEIAMRMAHLALRRIAFFAKAQELLEEAGERMATDVDAADFIIIRAISLLKRVGKDLDEIEPRIIELDTGSGRFAHEIEAISRLRAEAMDRRADAKRRMSE